MPARNFRIHLVNNTDFPLIRVPTDSYLQGEYTPGGWSPPDHIEPHEVGYWQSESDGVFQGTEGHLVYDIRDGKPVPDQVYIHWDNPWVGVTDSDGTFQVSTGLFEDRAKGQSLDFILEGGGRRALAGPEPINTAGWLEVIPGLVALPIPNLGIEDHAASVFALSPRETKGSAASQVPSFGSAAIVPFTFQPVLGGLANIWEGHWVYPPGEERNAKICIKISATKTSPMRSRWVLPGRAYHIEVLDNSGVPPIILQTITRESQESALLYRQDTWTPDNRGLRKFVASFHPGAISAPSASAYINSGTRATSSLQPSAAAATEISLTFPQSNRIAEVARHSFVLTEVANGLALGHQITLMLYSPIDSQGRVVGYSVRYLRQAADETTLIDVMLFPAAHPIN